MIVSAIHIIALIQFWNAGLHLLGDTTSSIYIHLALLLKLLQSLWIFILSFYNCAMAVPIR